MTAGSRRKRPTIRSAWHMSVCGSSIPSTAPAPSSRGGMNGAWRWPWPSRGGPCWQPSTAPAATNSMQPPPERAQASMASPSPFRIRARSRARGSPVTARRWAALPTLGIAGDPSGALPLQLRLAYVAAGRLDGAVSVGKRNDWDLAAGELLVIEAGGSVSGSTGEGYIYNRPEPWQQGLVAAGAKRHAALITALRST